MTHIALHETMVAHNKQVNRMNINAVEIGERYPDDSGWDKRVFIDLRKDILTIQMGDDVINAHPRDIKWIVDALTEADTHIRS